MSLAELVLPRILALGPSMAEEARLGAATRPAFDQSSGCRGSRSRNPTSGPSFETMERTRALADIVNAWHRHATGWGMASEHSAAID